MGTKRLAQQMLVSKPRAYDAIGVALRNAFTRDRVSLPADIGACLNRLDRIPGE